MSKKRKVDRVYLVSVSYDEDDEMEIPARNKKEAERKARREIGMGGHIDSIELLRESE